MTLGTLYGIGIGPGDPELITLKGARLIGNCRHVFVPKARTAAESIAMAIARRCLRHDAAIHELLFPMTVDRGELSERWKESAGEVAAVLKSGEDVCFLTLGDPLLYSTYIYLLRALREMCPDLKTMTVPGITAFSAAASLTEFPIGEAKEPVTIIPSSDDLQTVRRALAGGGTVIIMKIGKRLQEIIGLLREMGLIGQGVFVSRAGLSGQRIETNLKNMEMQDSETGYLSIILVHAGRRNEP
ncbi:MAG: precorrin-2 C(20)-methyltransferase [Deltaproteobacteria bacterium]|nr:precorrin-2 C(20)-methyltransferase [Deltaproteobacteria bacterium]